MTVRCDVCNVELTKENTEIEEILSFTGDMIHAEVECPNGHFVGKGYKNVSLVEAE